jgi:DNA-binding beta-propeller fold protein YncE
VKDWAKLPAGMSFGNTHGCIVVDSRNRVYVNTDTENAVIVFDANGKFLKSWGKEFAGGLHGMCVFKEEGRELMYLAHTSRHEVVKATLEGEVLQTYPFPVKAGVYKDKDEYKPTSVAVAPNGDFFVGDGYGQSWVHKYSAKGEYLSSWGGKGEEPGKMRTPHGVWVDTRRKDPVLLVADRGNHRLQVFDFDGKLLDMVTGILDLPCHIHQRGTDLVIPDLNGRVTILDKDNRLVAHLGENIDPERKGKNKVAADTWRDGEFIAPHCARWDARGDLYVMDWNFLGRITKLKRA